ncbi:MAG: hypothetical protein ABSH32_22035 [Bryobacteraceae bacterium]
MFRPVPFEVSLWVPNMIDDATSELKARFVRHDSTEDNMRLLWSYLDKHGRAGSVLYSFETLG